MLLLTLHALALATGDTGSSSTGDTGSGSTGDTGDLPASTGDTAAPLPEPPEPPADTGTVPLDTGTLPGGTGAIDPSSVVTAASLAGEEGGVRCSTGPVPASFAGFGFVSALLWLTRRREN